MVLIDSHRHSTQAGAHAISHVIVIDLPLLGGVHCKKTAQSHALKEWLFMRFHKSTTISKTDLRPLNKKYSHRPIYL